MSAAERASRLIPTGAGRKYVAGVPHALLSEAELEAALQGAMLEEREACARAVLCPETHEGNCGGNCEELAERIRGRPPP